MSIVLDKEMEFKTVYTVCRLTLQGTEIRDVCHHFVNARISVLNGQNKKEIHIEENSMWCHCS